MLSYHADMDTGTNPFELGLDRLVDLDQPADFIGKAALRRIRDAGVRRRQVGLRLDTAPLPGPNTRFWPIRHDGTAVGQVTSAVHSPRLAQNIALALVSTDHAGPGTWLTVETPAGPVPAEVVEKPFYDPRKEHARAG
jgi:aminomethyltransferase